CIAVSGDETPMISRRRNFGKTKVVGKTLTSVTRFIRTAVKPPMRSSGLLFTFLIMATLPFRPAFTQQTRPNPSEGDEDLRVGLISYDDPSTKVKEYQALFSEL